MKPFTCGAGVLMLTLGCAPAAPETVVAIEAPPRAPSAPSAVAGEPSSTPTRGCGFVASLLPSSEREGEEARDLVGAMMRGAIAAYERTDPQTGATGELCGSARAVPALPPRCGSAEEAPESLFDGVASGPTRHGWKCLRFAVTTPLRWQLGYVRGGPYRGLDCGAPHPGPDGFQVFAERDADGDGKSALVVASGTVRRDARTVESSEPLVIDGDE